MRCDALVFGDAGKGSRAGGLQPAALTQGQCTIADFHQGFRGGKYHFSPETAKLLKQRVLYDVNEETE